MYSHFLGHNSTTRRIRTNSAVFFAMFLFVFSTSFGGIVYAEESPPAEDPPVEESTAGETTQVEDTDGGSETEVTNEPEPEPESEPEIATVDTGDATAVGEVENIINTSDTNTLPPPEEPIEEGTGTSTPPVIIDEGATSTEPIIVEDPSSTSGQETGTSTPETLNGEEEGDPINETITNTSDGDVENNIVIIADTGDNSAGGAGDVSLITTGDSVAVANVLNVVNTNIYNSNGFFLFLSNLFARFSGEYDLRNYDFFNTEPPNNGGGCSIGCGEGGNVTLNNTSNADITNNVIVRSNTGDNVVNGAGFIDTGNAFAAANVINIANTNIVNSNYLLLTINNFGNLSGDVVFPTADLFARIFGNQNTAGGNINIENESDALVENNVEVLADTGDNDVYRGDGTGTILTGDSTAEANVINQVNTNLFGSNAFMILFRIHGDWTGNVFGAPEGLGWQETPHGVVLSYEPPEQNISDSGGNNGAGGLTIANNSTANISNNISVSALTGANQINGGGWVVSTGDAYASANVINVANTNVVGKNWLLAIVNIFGDWSGNIAFGRPDLWIGAQAEILDNTPGQRSQVVYNYTIYNNGDADATDVSLRTYFDHERLFFHPQGQEAFPSAASNELVWKLGDIPAGEVLEMRYTAQVSAEIPIGQSFIDTKTTVLSFEPDENYTDNTDYLTFGVYRDNISYSYGENVVYTPSPDLFVTKENFSDGSAVASSTVDYKIVVKNNGGGSAYQAILYDILEDEDGDIIYEEAWDLGEIYSGEEITVAYTAIFNSATKEGQYTNYAYVEALGRHESFMYGNFANSNVALSTVYILEYEEPEGEEEVIEIIEESVEITEKVIEIVEEKPKPLGALYGPLFNQHPVYRLYSFIEEYVYPQFAQHPMKYETSLLASVSEGVGTAYSAFRERLLRSSIVNFFRVSLFERLTRIAPQPYVKESRERKDNSDRVLALIVLSVFYLRDQQRNEDHHEPPQGGSV